MRNDSNNPLLKVNKSFEENSSFITNEKRATKTGIVSKTALGLFIFIATIIATQNNDFLFSLSTSWLFFIATFIIYIIGIFKMRTNIKWAKRLFFFYPIMEGMILSSAIFYLDLYVPGIAYQALIIVVLIFALMIVIYQLFEPLLAKLVPIFFIMFFGLFIIEMLDMTMGIFGGSLYAVNSDFGLFMSIAFVVLASYSYTLDFRRVSYMVKNNMPKEYEYYAALGLLITTIWLYVEVLRLIAILASRNND